MIEEKNRVEWVDIAKGVGITSIVLGHICICLNSNLNRILFGLIYSYHVPIFFFLSGYLYKQVGIIPFMKKKFKQLIIPYFFSYVVISIFIVKILNKNQVPFSELMIQLINGIITSDFSLGSLWFIPCFFVNLIIYNITKNYFSNKYTCCIFIGCFIIYSIIHCFYKIKHLPWTIDILPLTLFFTFMGDALKKYINKGNSNIVYIIGMIAILYVSSFQKNTLDLYYNYIEIPFITVICSIIIIIFIIQVSKILKDNFIAKILSILGKSSLTIMMFHMSFYYILLRLMGTSFIGYNAIVIYTVFTLTFSTILDHLFGKFNITRILFLGKYQSKN